MAILDGPLSLAPTVNQSVNLGSSNKMYLESNFFLQFLCCYS